MDKPTREIAYVPPALKAFGLTLLIFLAPLALTSAYGRFWPF